MADFANDIGTNIIMLKALKLNGASIINWVQINPAIVTIDCWYKYIRRNASYRL